MQQVPVEIFFPSQRAPVGILRFVLFLCLSFTNSQPLFIYLIIRYPEHVALAEQSVLFLHRLDPS